MGMNKSGLIDFEKNIAARFDNGEIPYLVHFSGGNEDQLIEIFKDIAPGDYIFSTHRPHYHYLLAGGAPESLEDKIVNGQSMFVFDRSLNFYSSSIVCGTPSIAAGVAWALKRKGNKQKVWCFLGDGAEDEGHLLEAARYVDGWELPCEFIIEDNDRSVNACKTERWGSFRPPFKLFDCVRRYHYSPTWPHGGTGSGKWLDFKNEAIVESLPEKRSFSIPQIKTTSADISYQEAVKASMEMLAKISGSVFIGYNVRHGAAYGTLSGVPEEQRMETPLAENLMAGLAMGMSLEGFRPILYFERHDFIFNALDALVNQLDKIKQLSRNEFEMPVIIKAVAGGIKPFYAGLTHTSDLTSLFRNLFSFPVFCPENSADVLNAYEAAVFLDGPIMISERKALY